MTGKATFVLVHDEARVRAMQAVANAEPGFVVTVSSPKKSRTLSQNAISHAWYEQLARELPENNALGWKCHCKLHCGVPILRAEDDDFRDTYDQVIKPMPYEKKLIVMRSWPVTSIMTTKQLTQYLDMVQEEFASRVNLEYPAEELPERYS